MNKLLKRLESVLSGRGHYEVHYPDGTVKNMSRDDLLGQPWGLQFSNPELF